MFKKIMNFLNERGWSSIPKPAKHFIGSLFLVLIFYGVPIQIFALIWNIQIQLFMSAVIAWGIGFWVEFRKGGNKSHKDIWTDFVGILVAVLICLI